ncbi:MAG: FecR domain-containing protein [Porphyrobacter sp.]|nr:FecR domain-containing protein [Porphyrobacter sp.]
MTANESMRDQAIAWAVRTGDPAFDDWDGFTTWLEADPAHSLAYDTVVAAVGEAAQALPSIPAAENDDLPVHGQTRRRWMGGAAALTLALVAAFGAWQFRGGSYTIETAPGEVQLVKLDDGSQIALAGGSRIVLDRSDPRVASLEQGQALFTVIHDVSAPFRVTVGDDTLVDVGTIFDVKRAQGALSVAVSEGAVVLNPKNQNVQVSRGQMLSLDTASGRYQVGEVVTEEVGEWREGRLTYHDAMLADVASDLSRATGLAFEVAPGSATHRVSGSLLIEPIRADPQSLGPLLGLAVRKDGEAWEIEAN